MKNRLYEIVWFVVALGFISLACWSSYNRGKNSVEYKEPVTITKSVFLYDTITNVQLNDRTVERIDTVELKTIEHDTVFVELPIERYELDTITADSCHLTAVLRGFNVSLDTLSIEYPKTSVETVIYEPVRKWRFGFGFAIGIGYVK